MPVTLYDALAQVLPSFSAGAQAAPAGGSIARLVAVPAAVKLAAVVFAVGAGGALTSDVAPRASRRVAIRVEHAPAPPVRRSAPTVAAIREAAAPAPQRVRAVAVPAPQRTRGANEPASDGQDPEPSTPSRIVAPVEESAKRTDPPHGESGGDLPTVSLQSEGTADHGSLSRDVQLGASQDGGSHGGDGGSDGGDGGSDGGSDSSS